MGLFLPNYIYILESDYCHCCDALVPVVIAVIQDISNSIVISVPLSSVIISIVLTHRSDPPTTQHFCQNESVFCRQIQLIVIISDRHALKSN